MPKPPSTIAHRHLNVAVGRQNRLKQFLVHVKEAGTCTNRLVALTELLCLLKKELWWLLSKELKSNTIFTVSSRQVCGMNLVRNQVYYPVYPRAKFGVLNPRISENLSCESFGGLFLKYCLLNFQDH